MKSYKILGAATLFAAAALAPAMAQTTHDSTAQQTSTSASQPAPAADSTQTGTYATGKPLEQQSKEGFWGHVNPLARKKWVHRQVDPIRDRANELDELQSKNRNDIHDVDTRATAGINKAMTAANAADSHAADAANRANAANQLASTADSKTTTLNSTVSNLDQYSQVSTKTIPFLHGRTALTKAQKDDLGQMASSLGNEKGYIVEVQGYSRAGVARSQAMADAVVRYLVTDENVPVYRIYRTGLGREKVAANDTSASAGEKPLTNGVRVTVLHNSLATMGQSGASNGQTTTTSQNPATPTPATGTTGQSTPQ